MLRTHLGPLLLWSNVVTFLLRFHYQLQKIKNPLFSTCCLALPVVRSCPIATKLLQCRECPLCANRRHCAFVRNRRGGGGFTPPPPLPHPPACGSAPGGLMG